jgi:hypothetical protein
MISAVAMVAAIWLIVLGIKAFVEQMRQISSESQQIPREGPAEAADPPAIT